MKSIIYNIIIQDTGMAAYLAIRGYCNYTCSLFFREIQVINAENVPATGPTIVYGNHNNQFVDGMLLVTCVKRPIGFVAAAASIRRRIIGDLLKLSHAIPLERAQDLAVKGQGKVTKIEAGIVSGKGTNFTTIKPKSILKIGKIQIIVDEVINDEMIKTSAKDTLEGNQDFKIIPKLQYSELYKYVWAALNDNKCIGIFPEGGSHDRLELLPFKAGICIMALGAMEKYGCPVTLVPAGFNYYNPQNFRSKVIIQFGPPYTVTQQLIDIYRVDKKKAISTLLTQLENMLKSVTTSCLSFDELSTLFFCRELYTRKASKVLKAKDKLQLNRRFAKGFDKLIKQPKFKQTYEQLKKFNQFTKLNGLSLTTNKSPNIVMDIFRFLFYLQKVLLRLIISLPGLILMGPTTSLIAYQAEKQRVRCLKKSEVKIKGTDVVGSYKILLSMIYFPITTTIHTFILYKCLRKFTDFDVSKCWKICLLVPLLMPIYALIFVQSYDSLGRSWKKLKFLFMRLFKRNIYTQFEQKKKMLSHKIVEMVNEYGDEVIEDFKATRIIKPQDIMPSSTQLLQK